jgi:hypothetical protein
VKINELFPAKYMKAEDFGETETKILTVKNYEVEEMGQGKEKQAKPVLYFRDADSKPLVLNKTNAAIISKFYGDDLDDWIGKKIALYAIEVESFGDIVRAIRVRTKQPAAAPAPAQPTDIDAEDELFVNEPAALPDMNIGAGVKIKSKQSA